MPGRAGSLWVDGYALYYVDQFQVLRRLDGIARGTVPGRAGSLCVSQQALCFVDAGHTDGIAHSDTPHGDGAAHADGPPPPP